MSQRVSRSSPTADRPDDEGSAVSRAEGPFFRVYDNGGRHRELALSPRRSRITIGRSPKADVSLSSDEEVSRVHATAEYLGEQWTRLDGGLSLNGTFINGDRLTGRHILRPGDFIRMGSSRFTFHDLTKGPSPVAGTGFEPETLQHKPCRARGTTRKPPRPERSWTSTELNLNSRLGPMG
ncbi:FHA domain-containing protein [Nocardia sp. NPDC059764]|uniref:FHA domain-containing protein n=1 Tax=Nocardia sp. NPDC059764 TaxID=3346939 RepID=UPI003666F20C